MAVKNQSTVRTKWCISQRFRRRQKKTNIRFIETPEELQPTQKCGNNFTNAPSNQPMRYEECISCWNKSKRYERVIRWRIIMSSKMMKNHNDSTLNFRVVLPRLVMTLVDFTTTFERCELHSRPLSPTLLQT